ncbi:nuclear transport factor 2 family protein [Hydrogenophaga sp. 5NK40-0174]|uniref:nuclear transport factor 2 family protein n=1 Tax=Hydrogenophaga sp. 5NK40-0174 TaxID=3127649 RepID=UPI00333F4DEB
MMKFWLLAGLMAAGAAWGQSGSLSRYALQQIVDRVDQAIVERDVKGIGSLLTPRAEISIIVPTPNGKRRMKMSKAQYISALEQSWAVANDYRYARSGLEFELNGDAAVIRSVVTEAMVVNGRQISLSTREETYVQVIDGRAMIVGVRGEPIKNRPPESN